MKLHKSDKIFAAERTVWNPKSRQASHENYPERKAVEDMKVGDILKVVHPNYSCQGIGKACSLLSSIRTWYKTDGKKFKSYHEDVNVVVLKRIK
jgi:hypothetical protein